MFALWESLKICNVFFCSSEQFFVKIELKLPAYNTRVKLTEDDTPEQFIKGKWSCWQQTVCFCLCLQLSLFVSQRRRVKRPMVTSSHGRS